jgi:phosphoketolase
VAHDRAAHPQGLEESFDTPWRAPVSALNILVTSSVWRPDDNGFSHQDPGFLVLVTNKNPRVTRIYLPPDANCLLSVVDHFLDSTDKINVVVLFRLVPAEEHEHGLSNADFDSLFTLDKPETFSFHGYPWLIHKLTYRRTNSHNIHVRGYKEGGNINTPMDLATRNQIDRSNLVIGAIDRIPELKVAGAHVKEQMKNQILECQRFAYSEGQDLPAFTDWQWPEK